MADRIGICIMLNKITDAKIIEHLKKQENKQGYIKGLILKDLHIKEQYK